MQKYAYKQYFSYLVGEFFDASLIFTNPLDRVTGLSLFYLHLTFQLSHLQMCKKKI